MKYIYKKRQASLLKNQISLTVPEIAVVPSSFDGKSEVAHKLREFEDNRLKLL